MPIFKFKTYSPHLSRSAWIAHDANIIGKIKIMEKASVWFGATLRGDNEEILVGEGSNIQENCVLHTDHGFPLKIGKGCLIGAGSLITENKIIPDGSLVMGSPGKVMRELDDEAKESLIGSALHYQGRAAEFSKHLYRLS